MKFNSKETAEHTPVKEAARVGIDPGFFNVNKNRGETARVDSHSRQYHINYLGDTEMIKSADIKKAGEMVIMSADFIRQHAETPVERKAAEILLSLINAKRIVLCDTSRLYGRSVYGSFCFDNENPYIAIDIDIALEKGTAELVDTLFHEAYHAAQYNAGNKNNLLKEEARAWNLGLGMSNKYRQEHGESVVRTRPYTEQELLVMGYSNREGCSGFAEICKEAP